MGAVFVPLTLVATTGLEDEDQGLASGLFNTSQQVGGALGLAILSTIAASHTNGELAGAARARLPLGVRRQRGLRARGPRRARDDAAPARRRADRADVGRRGDRRSMTLRADAQRNLDRLLEAAAECFAEQGVDASIDEIARRAGVGHGTVFRRFATKDALLAAILAGHMRRARDRRRGGVRRARCGRGVRPLRPRGGGRVCAQPRAHRGDEALRGDAGGRRARGRRRRLLRRAQDRAPSPAGAVPRRRRRAGRARHHPDAGVHVPGHRARRAAPAPWSA